MKLLQIAAFTQNATKCECFKNLEFTFKQYENNITKTVQGRHKENELYNFSIPSMYGTTLIGL